MQKEQVNLAFHCLIQDYFSELKDMQINMEYQQERDKGVMETRVEIDPNEYTILIYPEALDYSEQAFNASLALELSKIIYGLPNAKGLMRRYKINEKILFNALMIIAALVALLLTYCIVMVTYQPYQIVALMIMFVMTTVGIEKGDTWLRKKHVHKIAARNAWAEAQLIERNLGEDLLQLHREYHRTLVMFAGGRSMKEIQEATKEKKQKDLLG